MERRSFLRWLGLGAVAAPAAVKALAEEKPYRKPIEFAKPGDVMTTHSSRWGDCTTQATSIFVDHEEAVITAIDHENGTITIERPRLRHARLYGVTIKD